MKIPHVSSMPTLCCSDSDDNSSKDESSGDSLPSSRMPTMTRHGSMVCLEDMADKVETGVQPHIGYKKVRSTKLGRL
jgi:hypothetical protein